MVTEAGQLVSTGRLQELKNLKISSVKYWRENDKTLLHIAAASNQVEVIRYLADEAKVDINGQDSEGNTPLHLAVTSGHAEATNALLQCGANDAICNKDSHPPLHLAVKQGSQGISVLSEFVKHPYVNLHIRNSRRNIATIHAITLCNNVEALQLLYNKHISSAFSTIATERDKNGITVFHLAAQVGSHDVLEFLLSKCEHHGVNPKHLLCNLLKTPLHYAAERKHIKCIEVLIRHGSDPIQVTGTNYPPLHMVCWYGCIDTVKLMVSTCGQSILQSRDQNGLTTLHYAASKELISYLVENGVLVDDVDAQGISPLAEAIKLGNIVGMRELLRLKADPLTRDDQGNNLLHIAVLGKKVEIFRAMMSCECVASLATMANNDGDYPIHLALKLNVPEMVLSLLKLTSEMFEDGEGNNYLHLAALLSDETILVHLLGMPQAVDIINSSNHKGFTPLHSAAMGSSHTAVRKLSEHGAAIHSSNTGLTPFLCACSKGNLEAVKFLYNINTYQRNWVDHNGCTALHAAVEGGNKELITFCLDEGMDVTLNNDQLSFLDEILDMDNKELAKTVISHKRWAECIDMYCPSKPHPILRILDQMPDIYGIMLDNCLTKSSLSPHHRDYWEEYNFKCLVLPPPAATSSLTSEVDQVGSPLHPRYHSGGTACMKKEDTLNFTICRKLNKGRHRPYLIHPVVASYITAKWEGFGLQLYSMTMLCNFLLALLFSIFLVSIPLPVQNSSLSANSSENASNSSLLLEHPDSISRGATVLLFICLALGIIHASICLVQIYIHGADLILHVDDFLHVWSNMLGTTNILVFLVSILIGGLDSALWDAAALGVFFAWTTFNISLQLISVLNLGIYVIMITRTAVTIVKVMIVFVWVFFSFAMAFYVLVGTVDGLHYNTVRLSLYSSFHAVIATTDYLGFADLQQAGLLRFPVLVFILLVILIILIPIVFINILIGLAVGDIARIQEDAVITRQNIEVRTLSGLGIHLLPKCCKNYSLKKRFYPNRYFCGSLLTRLYHATFPKNDSSMNDCSLVELKYELVHERESYQRSLDQLQEKVNSLASDQATLLNMMMRQEAMISKLLHVTAQQ